MNFVKTENSNTEGASGSLKLSMPRYVGFFRVCNQTDPPLDLPIKLFVHTKEQI